MGSARPKSVRQHEKGVKETKKGVKEIKKSVNCALKQLKNLKKLDPNWKMV